MPQHGISGRSEIIRYRKNLSPATIRWNFTEGGHLLPQDNAAYDIGSAGKKVRHLFLSDNSIRFKDTGGTEHSLGINSTGKIVYGSFPEGGPDGRTPLLTIKKDDTEYGVNSLTNVLKFTGDGVTVSSDDSDAYVTKTITIAGASSGGGTVLTAHTTDAVFNSTWSSGVASATGNILNNVILDGYNYAFDASAHYYETWSSNPWYNGSGVAGGDGPSPGYRADMTPTPNTNLSNQQHYISLGGFLSEQNYEFGTGSANYNFQSRNPANFSSDVRGKRHWEIGSFTIIKPSGRKNDDSINRYSGKLGAADYSFGFPNTKMMPYPHKWDDGKYGEPGGPYHQDKKWRVGHLPPTCTAFFGHQGYHTKTDAIGAQHRNFYQGVAAGLAIGNISLKTHLNDIHTQYNLDYGANGVYLSALSILVDEKNSCYYSGGNTERPSTDDCHAKLMLQPTLRDLHPSARTGGVSIGWRPAEHNVNWGGSDTNSYNDTLCDTWISPAVLHIYDGRYPHDHTTTSKFNLQDIKWGRYQPRNYWMLDHSTDIILGERGNHNAFIRSVANNTVNSNQQETFETLGPHPEIAGNPDQKYTVGYRYQMGFTARFDTDGVNWGGTGAGTMALPFFSASAIQYGVDDCAGPPLDGTYMTNADQKEKHRVWIRMGTITCAAGSAAGKTSPYGPTAYNNTGLSHTDFTGQNDKGVETNDTPIHDMAMTADPGALIDIQSDNGRKNNNNCQTWDENNFLRIGSAGPRDSSAIAVPEEYTPVVLEVGGSGPDVGGSDPHQPMRPVGDGGWVAGTWGKSTDDPAGSAYSSEGNTTSSAQPKHVFSGDTSNGWKSKSHGTSGVRPESPAWIAIRFPNVGGEYGTKRITKYRIWPRKAGSTFPYWHPVDWEIRGLKNGVTYDDTMAQNPVQGDNTYTIIDEVTGENTWVIPDSYSVVNDNSYREFEIDDPGYYTTYVIHITSTGLGSGPTVHGRYAEITEIAYYSGGEPVLYTQFANPRSGIVIANQLNNRGFVIWRPRQDSPANNNYDADKLHFTFSKNDDSDTYHTTDALTSASGGVLDVATNPPIMSITGDKNVGIGITEPTVKLDVNGAVKSSGTVLTSDDRIKYNETELTSALDTINKLKPLKYEKIIEQSQDAKGTWIPTDAEWNNVKDSEDANGNKLWKWSQEIGLIAQDIRNDIPYLSFCVGGQEHDASGNQTLLDVKYNHIFTLSIAALQEVDKQLQAEKTKTATLETTVSSQQTTINDLVTRIAALENA